MNNASDFFSTQPSSILVTGSHRSGSTWVGNMLNLAEGTRMVWEPFNVYNGYTKYWFEKINIQEESHYTRFLKNSVHFSPISFLNDITKLQPTVRWRFFLRMHLEALKNIGQKKRIIFKDPIALMSADWMQERLGVLVLIVIRHPAAFVSSLKIKNWTFDFQHFLQQPQLMEEKLAPFKAAIEQQARSTDKDVIQQGALLWNCFHHVIHEYQVQHPEWIYVKHEDLSAAPVLEFKKLYQQLDLLFSPEVEQAIITATGSSNQSELHSDTQQLFERNSKENIYNWKNRLSQEEIKTIYNQTQEIAQFYYDDDCW